MRRWVLAGVAAFVLAAAGGVVVTLLQKARAKAAVQQCEKNLGDLARFAAHHARPPRGVPADKLPTEVPAGTVVLTGVPPDDRLSWVVHALPGMDAKRQDPAAVLAALDPARGWAADRNQGAARVRLAALLCPGTPAAVVPDQPAPTQYVGVAGLGADAATIPLAFPAPAPPRAGCFRYDAPTPFAAISDGLSQTLLLGERSGDVGPWLRGGPATVRGLDDAPAAPPLLGAGGQFGGNHVVTANWAMADGSVRTFTPRVDPKVLFALATIAGKETDPLPGE